MRSRDQLFRTVCFLASALLLVLTLTCSAKLAAWNDRAGELEAEKARLEEENRILRARASQDLPLDELEELAIREYGMQIPAPEQIIWVPGPIK